MTISKEKTEYHEYLLQFDKAPNFPDILAFCRAIKEQYSWKEFSYHNDKKGWVFSKPEILTRLCLRFPELHVDPVLASYVVEAKEKLELQERQRQLAQEVKLKDRAYFP